MGASTHVYANRLGGFAGAVKAGLGLLMVATPVGWVGLIVGGLAVAGAAATTSIVVNNSIKDNSGSWYDSIMNALSVK